ncbi:MAG: sugar ABC transporter permease [Oscillospiraceae bacterium]|nr:sugar ABC transporter permease [Oscillospiraceae bacterium]
MASRRKNGSARRTQLISACFLTPSAMGVLVFFVIPFGVIVYYSLVDNPIQQSFVGLDNYISLLQNTAFRLAARNTLLFSGLAVVLSLGLAVLLEKKIPLKSQLRSCFLSPLVVPAASVVLIWQVIFHYNGALNSILSLFGLEAVDWLSSAYSIPVMVVLFLWKNLGYNMVLFMATLANIPREPLEAAMIDGASARVIFFRFKLRYLSPTLVFVTIMSLVNSFKIFREIYLLTGDYPYESLYMLQHFMNNTFRSLDYQKLSSAAVVMLLVIAGVIAVLFALEKWLGRDLEQ